jgi:hypothetical protein
VSVSGHSAAHGDFLGFVQLQEVGVVKSTREFHFLRELGGREGRVTSAGRGQSRAIAMGVTE